MERRSTKHGPARDEQLKHETAGLERGTPQRPHLEVEPSENIPVSRRQATDEDIALRSELARLLSRGDFPADRDTLLARLADADAPPELHARLSRVTSDRTFTSTHDVMVALGISAPENRPRRPGAG
jgi:hypothetical protein